MRASGPQPIYPILLAAYFVLFLLSQNLTEVTLVEVLPVVAVAVIVAALATIVSGLAFRNARRGAVIIGAIVVVFFGYGHVAELARPLSGTIQQVGWLAFLAVAVIVALRGGRRLVRLTSALNVIAGVLVLATLVTIVPHELGRTAAGLETTPIAITGNGVAAPKRDIYYLIFDRYAATDEMKKHYGIDNPLNAWLESRGFYVATDSHANYVKTQLSIASSLNMTHLDELAARMGPDSDDEGPIFEMFHAHALARFVKAQGYRYVQVGSRYQPTNANPYADENPQPGGFSDFTAAIVDTSAIPALARRLGLTKATPARERYYDSARFQWRILDQQVDRPGPKLVFCHFLLPHPPYVFAADGSFVAKEDDPNDMAREYAGMVAYANSQIERLVDKLLALPEERRPIIVLQADEGPYPARYNVHSFSFDWSTATGDELRLKYGILNAYYLPGLQGDTGLYKSITPVNSFRLILSRYFGANLPLLPDRIYTSKAKTRPYVLTDVTDRIAQP